MNWIRDHRHFLVYVFLVLMQVATAYVLVDQRAESDWQTCHRSNESRQDINERFDRLDKILVSFGDPTDPRSKKFLEDEKKAALPVRDCGPRP